MVPRALFENGLVDEAFELMTQPEYPGYTYLFETLHLTALPEQWGGSGAAGGSSLLHGAFSDIAACMYRYLAGFRHSPENPGRKHLEIRPRVPAKLNDFQAEYIGYTSSWTKDAETIRFHFVVPEKCTADVVLSNGEKKHLKSGSTDMVMKKQKKTVKNRLF